MLRDDRCCSRDGNSVPEARESAEADCQMAGGKPEAGACIYRWQKEINAMDCFSDSDWAGDLEKRKSTSGMAFMHGLRLVHFLSSTQMLAALFTAEAEWYACIRTASRSLALIEMARCIGLIVKGRLHLDLNAAKGIAQRRGVGKIRHLATQTLWLQEILQRQGVNIFKVAGGDNPADVGTKHVATQAEYWKCLDKMCVFWKEGRSDLAFDVAVSYLEEGGQQ